MRSLRWGAAGLAAVALSGCWLQPQYGPAGQNSNPFETRITSANAATLTEAWSVATPYVSQPLVRGDRVYLGGTRPVGTSQVTGVDALALGDGSPVWTRDLVTTPNSIAVPLGPTFSGGELWMGALPPGGPTPTFDTEVTRLDPDDGTTLGSEIHEGMGGVPATSGDLTVDLSTLDFDPATATSRLVVRDLATRATRWTAELPLVASGPVVGHGTIYLTVDHTLYAFAAAGCGATTCAPAWTAPIAARGDGDQVLVDAVADNGDLVLRQTWLVTDRFGNVTRSSVVSTYDGDDGTFLRGLDGGSVTFAVAVAGDRVYVVGRDDSVPFADHHVRATSLTTGTRLWEAELPELHPAAGRVVVGGDVAYVGIDDAVLAFARTCGAPTCAPLTELPVDGIAVALSVAQGHLLVISTPDLSTAPDEHRLTAFTPTAP
jgi:hypothetical protein